MSQKGGRMIGRVVGRAACIGALGLAIGGCGAGTAFLGGSGGPFGFFQQMQNQIIQLIKDQSSEQDQVKRLNSDLAASVRDKQQLTRDRDAALNRAQTVEKDLAAAQAGTGLKLPMEYFDLSKATITPAGTEGLTNIAATAKLWINPLLIYVPESAIPIVKKFFSDAGIAENQVVIVPAR